MASRSEVAPKVEEVCLSTKPYASRAMPQHGLVETMSSDFRVYVIECEPPAGCRGPFFYVGIEHRSKVGARLKQHWGGSGAFYTKTHSPKSLHLLWPAQNTAVEGYVFLALLGTMHANNVHRVGGWTQTSTSPSPLSNMVFEQQRKLLRGLCFNCGGAHWASACPKAVQGLNYKCPHCSKGIVVSSRGQSVVGGRSVISPSPASASASVPASAQAPLPLSMLTPASSVSVAQKRSAPAPTASPERPMKAHRASTNAGKVVSVCGRLYTSISWYLGKPNPSQSHCSAVKAVCTPLELRGGDLRTLAGQGFAVAPPLRPKPLLAGRVRLPSAWLETGVQCDRSVLEVRKAGDNSKTSLRQCLWLLEDLETVLGDKKR